MEAERAKTPGERLHEWLQGRFTVRSFAARCGVSPSYISELRTKDRVPSAALREAVERETGGLITATDWLARPRAEPKPPTSERRPRSSMAHDERLEASIQEARDELDVVESDGARASLRATIIRAEQALAKLRVDCDIEKHPAYPTLVSDLVDAVVEVFGKDKLKELGAAVERREAARAAGRKAA